MRELIEFECNDCNGFFRVNLNLEIEGDFLFVCPQCGREHPRTIRKGEMVGDPWDRFYPQGEGKRIARNNKEKGERIMVPKSAYSKESLLRNVEKGGFLSALWMRKMAAEQQAQGG
jgi:hypothetical protein